MFACPDTTDVCRVPGPTPSPIASPVSPPTDDLEPDPPSPSSLTSAPHMSTLAPSRVVTRILRIPTYPPTPSSSTSATATSVTSTSTATTISSSSSTATTTTNDHQSALEGDTVADEPVLATDPGGDAIGTLYEVLLVLGGMFLVALLIWIAVNTLGTSYESTRAASSSVSILQQGRARTPGRIVGNPVYASPHPGARPMHAMYSVSGPLSPLSPLSRQMSPAARSPLQSPSAAIRVGDSRFYGDVDSSFL